MSEGEGPQLVEPIDRKTRRSSVKDRVVEALKVLAYIPLSPIIAFSFLAALFIRFYELSVRITRDPKVDKHTRCPGCGWKVGVRMNLIRTTGTEKAAIQLTCLNCGAEFYVKLRVPAEKWLAPLQVQSDLKEKVRDISL